MTAPIDELACYVPHTIRRGIADGPDAPPRSLCRRIDAAVLFADVSGFTPLAGRLAERGAEGAEELTRILNGYYSRLVARIGEHGGDVVRFAGDALLVVWPAGDGGPARAAVRAAACALAIQRDLGDYEPPAGVRLSVRMSIAAGRLVMSPLGGVGDSWQLVVAGEPLDQIRLADTLAGAGDVVLSPQAADLACTELTGEPLADGHLRLDAAKAPPDPAPPADVPLEAGAGAALRRYVPRTVLYRLDAGQADFLADLRRISVLFVRLGSLDSSDPGLMDRLQQVMTLLQTTAETFEGTVVQLMADDKGTVAILGFGLPPFMHEDDAVRAIRAARAIRRGLGEAGVEAGMGIATGPVYCGPLGSADRREYTIMGEVVNLAARLMQHSHDDLLCDGRTRDAAGGAEAFHPLPRFRLKGIAEAVPVFRPVEPGPARGAGRAIIGRHRELDDAEAVLRQAGGEASRVLIVTGEAGIGKSTLLTKLIARAPALGLAPLVGEASAIEKSTPYFAWRGVFAKILGVGADPASRAERVLARLESLPGLVQLAPLLNMVLDLGLPENEIVAQLAGRARADNLHRLLLGLLEAEARDRPLLIVLDDAQWLDPTSWNLARMVVDSLRPLVLVLAMRPPAAPMPPECRQVMHHAHARRLSLELLKWDETVRLVQEYLGWDRVSDALADYLHERSQGNPFFAEQLTAYLRDKGLISVVDGRAELAPTGPDGPASTVPHTVRDLVTTRIDQLAPSEQMTIKTASVIGRTFAYPTLRAVYPVDADRDRLIDHLEGLFRQNLTWVEARQPELIQSFRHVIIQQVTYDQLPRAQRSRLHGAIAAWFEEHFGQSPSHFPLIAHHWGLGQSPEKELEYLSKSGEESLRTGANHEAVEFFEKALDRHGRLFPGALPQGERSRAAHWQRSLGEAAFKLGDLPRARRELEESLGLLGRPSPTAAPRIVLDTLGQIAVQAWHVVRRRPLSPRDDTPDGEPPALDVREEAALANQRLAQIHYFTNELLLGTNRAMRALNLGESTRRSPGLARSYANMAIVTGMIRRRRMADRYARLAESTARRTGHLPSLAYALNVGGIYRLGVGRWDDIRRAAEESTRVSETLGDQRQLGESITLDALRSCFLGDFRQSARAFERLLDVGTQSGNTLHQAWGLCGRAECRFRQGRLADAVDDLQRAARLLEGKTDRTEEIRVGGLLAVALWRWGRKTAALEHAARTAELISHFSFSTASTLEGVAGVAETYLGHWANHPDDPAARRAAATAVAEVRAYARIFPIGRARAWRFRGLVHRLRGGARRAEACFARSIRSGEQFGMDLEVGLACLELGRHLPAGEPRRRDLLARALAIFQRLEMPYEEDLAKAAQSEAPGRLSTPAAASSRGAAER